MPLFFIFVIKVSGKLMFNVSGRLMFTYVVGVVLCLRLMFTYVVGVVLCLSACMLLSQCWEVKNKKF